MGAQTSASGAAPPEAISIVRRADSDERGIAILTASGLRRIAEINEEHRLAAGSASQAVQHAIRCGELLLEAKASLRHGEFSTWIRTHCTFAYSTAARYMAAARAKLSGVEISGLSALFPSGRATSAPLLEERGDGETSTTPSGEVRVIVDGSALMSGAPSSSRKLAVDRAVETLKAGNSCRTLLSELRHRQSVVTKSRSRLSRAERELLETEREVLKAARRPQQQVGRGAGGSAAGMVACGAKADVVTGRAGLSTQSAPRMY
jgi:hypothetical protein